MIRSTQRQDVMMSSNQMQTIMEPVSPSKVHRLEAAMGTISPVGLSKAASLSGYSHDKAFPYGEAYVSYSLHGQEGVNPLSPWSPMRTYERSVRSPATHPSVTEGSITNRIIYRPENVVFPVDGSPPAVPHELAAKHKFAYYGSHPTNHSPNVSGIITPVAVRTHPLGTASVSPSAENPVGLTIPKPVYGQRACCSDHECLAGHRYAVERGQHRHASHIYDEEWMLRYGHLSYLQQREQEVLMQQRVLQLERGGERVPLKEMTAEGYHGMGSNGPMSLPAFMRPNHGSYPCSPIHPLMTSSPERHQRFHSTSKIYNGLPSSHPSTYQPVSVLHHGLSKAYLNHPHMPKYAHMPQHAMFYQSHQNMPEYKKKNSSEHYKKPQPVCSDIPNHYPLTPGTHAYVRSMPSYHYGKLHVDAGNTASPSFYVPYSSSQHSDIPVDFSMPKAQATGLQREPPKQSGVHGTFQCGQSEADCRSLHHVAAERCGAACSGLRRSPSPNGGRNECAQTPMPKHPHDRSSVVRLRCTLDKDVNDSPAAKRLRVENGSETMPSEKQMRETNHERTAECQTPPSPPMPIISNFFSLAPYKMYLESTEAMSVQRETKNSEQEHPSRKLKPDSKTEDEDKPNVEEHDRDLSKSFTKVSSDCATSGQVLEAVKIKSERIEPQEFSCSLRMNKNCSDEKCQLSSGLRIKEENVDSDPDMFDRELKIVIKSDYELDMKPPLPAVIEASAECKKEPPLSPITMVVSTPGTLSNPPTLEATPQHEALIPPQTSETRLTPQKVPPLVLGLSSSNVVLPDMLRAPAPKVQEASQTLVEANLSSDKSRQARHQFMELHHSLCRLVTSSISETPHQKLRTWLTTLDLGEQVSQSPKTPKVSRLLGAMIGQVWLRNEEIMKALQTVVSQLGGYISNSNCPFPHVMRAGTAFIPMLVVKETLFPQVHGAFIDQVLQEHRVGLRPTTLSEERHLTQLQRRPCSSRLGRLVSLKHLPNIYPDILNLLYHANVCKFLGVELDSAFKMEHMGCPEEVGSSTTSQDSPRMSSIPSKQDTQRGLKDLSQSSSVLKKHMKKSSTKNTSMGGLYLEKSDLSAEEELTEESKSWSVENSFPEEDWEKFDGVCQENDGNLELKMMEETLEVPVEPVSWACPLTSDELSCGTSDLESESASSLSCKSQFLGSAQTQDLPRKRSGMILKLRKVFFSKGRRTRETHYQTVTNLPEIQGSEKGDSSHRRSRERSRDQGGRRDSPQRRRRHGGERYSPALPRPCLHRVYSQIKYCSYPPSFHSAEHRRRWVLRSAVQTAKQTTESCYPDLVGKRIRHLYEENDKTEVWYRGVVLRVYEPHPNPLKTVFEVKYDSEPEWQYYLELLVDYKKGWLKVED